MEWLWIVGGFAVFGFIGWIYEKVEDAKRLESQNKDLLKRNDSLNSTIDEWEAYNENKTNAWKTQTRDIAVREKELDDSTQAFGRLFKERTKNFPLIAQVWADLSDIADSERERALQCKRNPALKAAEEVSAIKKEKRALIKELVSWKYKAQNYEAIYPWLEEELAVDIEDEVNSDIYYSVYTERERIDPVTELISPEDYRQLSVSERNQLALNRYWMRGKKTKWMIGKMYERYVGYLYEKDGWDVQYFGIHKRFEDLGRDLIATKGDLVHVVQCKNWASFKTIYENHIFQLFGTTFSLQQEMPHKKVVPVLYTSTVISATAAEFARLLDIEINENKKFENYPAIKCNISPTTLERIYHLPFDQQYDNVQITTRTGEFYAATILGAEAQGFRRAFRWHGTK